VKKNKIISILSSTLLSLSFLLSTNYSFAQKTTTYTKSSVVVKTEYSEINWEDNYIRVKGTGAFPEKGSIGQKKLSAIRAAKLDAYRKILEIINGVKIDSETTVKDFALESDIIKSKVEGFVKGAREIGESIILPDETVELIVEVKIFGDNSLAGVVMKDYKRDENIKKTELEPVEVKPKENKTDTYTSLIVDATNLGVEPSMSPSIKDSQGGEIYIGDLEIDVDKVIEEGIVAYEKNLEEAKKNSRAGKFPLIVKASGVKGNFKSDVYVTDLDAQKILGANKLGNFLKDFKVIFVI